MSSIPLGILHWTGLPWPAMDGGGWLRTALVFLFVIGPGQFLATVVCRMLLGTDREIHGRVARHLRKHPTGRRRERPFIGFSRGLWIWSYHAFARQQDSVAIVGPPRSGKSTGILIPQLAMWDGSAVSTSIKPDVLSATLRRRERLARRHGGRVYVYAPTSNGTVCGFEPMRWSPVAGCEDPVTCQVRVKSLVYAAGAGAGTSDATHWRDGACAILRGLFGASAVHPTRPCDLRVVIEWLNDAETAEPAGILRNFAEQGGEDRAQALEGIGATEWKERSSMFSAARMALSGLANPLVLQRSYGSAFDVDEFLSTCSTLYVVSPTTHQEGIAPLISALIESITSRAYELDHVGALPNRLLLSLDEVCNIAPLPTLPAIVSQGGGQGCNAAWAAQSFAQLRARYGKDGAGAIWSAANARIVLGGIGDSADLEEIARMCGGHPEHNPMPGIISQGRRRGRPPVSARMLREIPDRTALLMYGNRRPYWIRIPRWSRALTLRWAVRGAPTWAGAGLAATHQLPGRIRERLATPPRPALKPTPAKATPVEVGGNSEGSE